MIIHRPATVFDYVQYSALYIIWTQCLLTIKKFMLSELLCCFIICSQTKLNFWPKLKINPSSFSSNFNFKISNSNFQSSKLMSYSQPIRRTENRQRTDRNHRFPLYNRDDEKKKNHCLEKLPRNIFLTQALYCVSELMSS